MGTLKKIGTGSGFDAAKNHGSLTRISTGERIEYNPEPVRSLSAVKTQAAPITTDISGEAWTRSTPSQSSLPSGYTSSQEQELSRLQEQRRQAQVDLDTETMNSVDAQMKAIRAEAGNQTFSDRASDTFSGMLGTYGSGIVNAFETVFDRTEQNEKSIRRLQTALETGRTNDGKQISDSQRETIRQAIDDLSRKNEERKNNNSVSDRMLSTGQQQIESAKQGLGKAGQFAVDLGVAGGQMAVDIGLGAVTGGSALIPMAVRSFGSGAQAARQSGASYGQQLAYGAGSAALSTATERIFSVAAPFKAAFGEGLANKAAGKLIAKFGENQAVQIMSRLANTAGGKAILSAITEGSEEVIEDLVQPYLKRATYDQNASFDANEAKRDFMIGAILGGIGSGFELAGRGIERIGKNQAVERTGVRHDAPISNSSPASESAVQANTEASAETSAESGRSVQSGPVDALPEILLGGKRVDQSKLTQEQFDAAIAANEKGTVDMDAAGRVYQVDPAQHIDQRTVDGVADRSVNAFQFDHPSLHSYYQTAARALIADAELSLMFPMNRRYERTMQGNKVRQSAQATEHLRMAMDETGLSRAEIIDAAQRIVHDQGQENVKAAKQVEIILDSMLTNGWSTMSGDTVAPNQAYIDAKNSILGSQPQAEREPLPMMDDGLGAADAGFTTRGMDGREQTSRLAESMPYNRYEEEATGLTKEEYDKLFRYQSQTEEKSVHLAEETLYFQQDGQRKFLLDVDPEAFSELVKSLDDATAWNGPQMDAAHMIQAELQGRSANMEIPSETYTEWLKIMREHETSTGQGVQANAKYSRTDNSNGQATELEALENLEKSRLSDSEKQAIFRKIVKLDVDIEGVKAGDTASMKRIIMEVAQERGVVNGPMGKMFTKLAESSLDSMTFDQLKQFAYSSTSALSTDSNPANTGQKLKTIQVLNMLSSPKTAMRNLLGNTTFYGIDAISMDGAAVIDMAVSKLTGTRSIAMERSALGKASLADAAKAMQMSIAEITLDVDMDSETNRYGTGSNRTFKASGNIVERALSAIERNQAYLLVATDEFFKGAARGTAENTQKLVDAGKIKTDNANYATEQANQLARYRTFQDDSKVSVAIQQIHDVFNLIGIGDSGKTIKGKTVHAFGAGDSVAPFTRVAGNLVSRFLEYSPVNAVKGTVEIAQQVAKAAGGHTVDPTAQAKGVSDMARGMTGTAIAYGFMLLAKSGLLRQADDEDDADVAALNTSEGIEGTQLNITAARRALSGGSAEWQSGDTLIDLSSVEPLNFLMNLGTEMAKSEQNPLVSSFKATKDSAFDAATELPVLQSAGNFATDVLKYGEDPGEVIVREAASTGASSFIPNILTSVARGMDDRPRNAYTRDTLSENIVDTVKNKIPGLRETLPGSVNTMGEEKLYQGSQTDILLNALLNPVGVNTYTQSDVSQEMQRVRKATGETSFYPTATIPKKLSSTKDGVTTEKTLDYEQRQDFQRDRGATLMITMSDMMGTSAYKAASETDKVDLLNLCYDYAYQTAKANVLGEDSAEKWVLNARNARKDIGISTGEFLALYNKYRDSVMSGDSYEKTKQAVSAGLTVEEYAAMKKSADFDRSGRVTKDEALKALDGVKNRVDLWDIICTTGAKNPYK